MEISVEGIFLIYNFSERYWVFITAPEESQIKTAGYSME